MLSFLVQLCWGGRGAAGSLGTGLVSTEVLLVMGHPGQRRTNSWGSLNPGELLEQVWFGRIWVAMGD